MSSLARPNHGATRRPLAGAAGLKRALAMASTVLGWPLRVYANRKLLHQMAGMSAYELADIGLTPADLRDVGALPLDTEVGQFLSTRVSTRRRVRGGRV